MSQKRQAQLSVVELQQEYRHDEESNNKCVDSTNGNDQQQQQHPGLNVDCKQSMNLPPPPQADDPVIMQFEPVDRQWELNDENIQRIGPQTGEKILHNYCKYINTTPLEVYRYLIETKGCDINAQDEDKNTPLHYALRYFKGGDIAVLIYLLSQGNVNVSIRCQYGYTLLHEACQHINSLPIDVFKILIEKKGRDINAQDNNKNTPFHKALEYFEPRNGGDIAVLHYLLSQKGINRNTKNKHGYTLLHRACININKLPLDVFKLLIETPRGCAVNAKDEDKGTPIHCALRCFDPNNGGNIVVLMYLLTQKGVNGNIKGWNGYTTLHTACININSLPLETFKLLIETIGCDVNAQDDDKDTPLHNALVCFNQNDGGDTNVLMYLLSQKDINVNIKNSNGYTLLHRACININKLPLEIFELLVETIGCDVNVRDNDDGTPIHRTLRYFDPNNGGDITVFAYLLNQMGVNANIRGKFGRNLLHLTCISNLPHSALSKKPNAENDTILCQIVEIIVEKCVQWVLDGKTPKTKPKNSILFFILESPN
jgi:ankyrin repeat protein